MKPSQIKTIKKFLKLKSYNNKTFQRKKWLSINLQLVRHYKTLSTKFYFSKYSKENYLNLEPKRIKKFMLLAVVYLPDSTYYLDNWINFSNYVKPYEPCCCHLCEDWGGCGSGKNYKGK